MPADGVTAPARGAAPPPVARADFDRVYDAAITGRFFVEEPEYYVQSRERFWRSLKRFERVGLPAASEILDVGGGQFAILLDRLAGHRGAVGDVVDRAEADVREMGLGFQRINLLRPPEPDARRYDCVTLLEVIEHLPHPAYVVFENLRGWLKPGGVIFLTTPNGYRLRNVAYMLLGREILDHYRYPEGDEGMGHQLEYTLAELEWQVSRAGLELLFAETYDEGWRGATPLARAARLLTRPVNVVPHLRNSIVLAARLPA